MTTFLKKTEQEVAAAALKQLERNTDLTDLYPGSIARALVDIISKEIGDVYSALDFDFTQGMLDKARGTGLDFLGNLLGVSRRSGSGEVISRASCSFYFYLNSSPVHTPGVPNTTLAGLGLSELSIPAGTMVSTSGDYIGRRLAYTTVDDILLSTSDSMSYCGLQPSATDLLLNAGSGTLVVHSLSNYPQLFCYNPKSVNAIVQYENDDEYRFRIRYEMRRIAKANHWALYMAALTVDGIRSVKVREFARGLASVDLIISPYRAAGNRASFLSRVQVAVDDVRAAGINVLVRYPDFYPVSLIGSLVLSDTAGTVRRDNLTQQATDIVSNYFNSLGPGDPLIYNQVVGRVMDLGGAVRDFVVRSFAVNGNNVPRANYDTSADVQLYAGDVAIS